MSEFRKIAPFQFYGVESGSVNGTAIVLLADAHMAIEKARALRDWLNRALPCEHKGPRSGTTKWGEPTLMKCHECGAEVPAFYRTPGFY